MNPITRTHALIAWSITLGQCLQANENKSLIKYGTGLIAACCAATRTFKQRLDRSKVRQIYKAYRVIEAQGWLDGVYDAESTISFVQAGLSDAMEASGNVEMVKALDEVNGWLDTIVLHLDPDLLKTQNFELAGKKYRQFLEVV